MGRWRARVTQATDLKVRDLDACHIPVTMRGRPKSSTITERRAQSCANCPTAGVAKRGGRPVGVGAG